ncbi:hypothetical protein EC973_003407 [Apophysomyces ossiformis]|uniref:Uncharacterized protein n=1 Tax=Apophysomyces ossiformis TaxID=679940 RepID=A0A8H7ETL1_9FUNG|nr:hypothetical protein EC973_003407 [Apophysomyces ossiformis]
MMTPRWAVQFWWPMLLGMQHGPQMDIHLQSSNYLTVWRLSAITRHKRDYQSNNRRFSTNREDQPHSQHTIAIGVIGYIGAKNENPQLDPLKLDEKDMISFLLSMNKHKRCTLNGYPSALATIFAVLHPSDKPLTDGKLLRQFFQAMKKMEFVLPRVSDEIWDV